MLLMVTINFVLLAVFIQHIEGFDRVIVVTESRDDISDQDETVIRAMRSRSGRNSCCIYGNCSCQSLYGALVNLTNNVLINITTDVELSSIIQKVNLANVAITGYNNPTVNCNNSGGLHFISCSNCTIEGITWKKCGSRNISGDENTYPVLQLASSSNIIIQNCSFQHSVGQAVVLLGVSEDVNINYCSFSYAKQYKVHGTAICYSSNNNKLIVSPLNIVVSNCNFFYKEGAKSIVYFDQPSNKHYEVLNLRNCKFIHNKGVPIYLSNQDLHINGNVKFYNNIGENGGGIFGKDHSNVIFHKSGIIEFTNNTASFNGGAIYLTNHSSILFKGYSTPNQCCDHNELNSDTYYHQIFTISFTTCIVKFQSNTADGLGQDIYVHNSSITVDDNAKVMFDSSYYQHSSSGVYVDEYSTFTFKGDSLVTFHYNITATGSVNGGALYIESSTITFEENLIVIFYENLIDTSGLNGGAAYVGDVSTITFKGNSTVTFYINKANNGGALCINSSNIIFKGSTKVTFKNNFAEYGGAVYIDNSSIIVFEENSKIIFDEGLGTNGGALYIDSYDIIFKGNSNVVFKYHLSGQSNDGGAVYIHDHSTITFEGASTVSFNANQANNGGALYIEYSNITSKGNSKVTFNDNRANSKGAAVYINLCTIVFEEYTTITFSDGSAENGGAVYIRASNITLNGNSMVIFYNNVARGGGAVYAILRR